MQSVFGNGIVCSISRDVYGRWNGSSGATQWPTGDDCFCEKHGFANRKITVQDYVKCANVRPRLPSTCRMQPSAKSETSSTDPSPSQKKIASSATKPKASIDLESSQKRMGSSATIRKASVDFSSTRKKTSLSATKRKATADIGSSQKKITSFFQNVKT